MAWTSPRITHFLHHLDDFPRLFDIGGVSREASRLGREPAAPPLSPGRLVDRLPGSLGSAYSSPPREVRERPRPVVA
jgi:hypothetical protein